MMETDLKKALLCVALLTTGFILCKLCTVLEDYPLFIIPLNTIVVFGATCICVKMDL